MKSASSEDHSVDIFATSATTTPAIETVAMDTTTTKESRMEAPEQTSMVRDSPHDHTTIVSTFLFCLQHFGFSFQMKHDAFLSETLDTTW